MTPTTSRRRPIVPILILATSITVPLFGNAMTSELTAAASTDRQATDSSPKTPAERSIAEARSLVEKYPDSADAHSRLAMAFAKRGRETADPSYYEQGLESAARALELDATSLDARRNEVWLLLGLHDFEKALNKARTLNDLIPDDPMVYGLLADAQLELGDYAGAEESVQWMLDLRPGAIPALTRGAYLRELFGDLDGAMMWMNDALNRTDPAETEDRAWILAQMAHLEIQRGNAESAAELAEASLELFPSYHYALAELAKAATELGDLERALELWQHHYEVSPHPENLFHVAAALDRLGRADEAQPLYLEFEKAALAESTAVDNANGELISYWIERAGKPGQALELAAREVERRRTVFTLDAYAKALFANGRTDDARIAIEEALDVGTVDPGILANAETILTSAAEPVTVR